MSPWGILPRGESRRRQPRTHAFAFKLMLAVLAIFIKVRRPGLRRSSRLGPRCGRWFFGTSRISRRPMRLAFATWSRIKDEWGSFRPRKRGYPGPRREDPPCIRLAQTGPDRVGSPAWRLPRRVFCWVRAATSIIITIIRPRARRPERLRRARLSMVRRVTCLSRNLSLGTSIRECRRGRPRSPARVEATELLSANPVSRRRR